MADEPPPRDGGSTPGAAGPNPERPPFRRYFAPDDAAEPPAEESPADAPDTGPTRERPVDLRRDDAWFRRAPGRRGGAPSAPDEDWYGDETGRTESAAESAGESDDRPSPYFNVPDRRGSRGGPTRRPQTPMKSTPPAPPKAPDTTSEPEPEPAEATPPRPEPDDRPSPYFNVPRRRRAGPRGQAEEGTRRGDARPDGARPDEARGDRHAPRPEGPRGDRPGDARADRTRPDEEHRDGPNREPARGEGPRWGGVRPEGAGSGGEVRPAHPRAGSPHPAEAAHDASGREPARAEGPRAGGARPERAGSGGEVRPGNPRVGRSRPGEAGEGSGREPARFDSARAGGPHPGEAHRDGTGPETARPEGLRAGGVRPVHPQGGSTRPDEPPRDRAGGARPGRDGAGARDAAPPASRVPARRDGHDGTARLRFTPCETPANRDDDTPCDPKTSRALPASSPPAPQAPDGAHGSEDPQDPEVRADQGDSTETEATQAPADTAAQPRTLRRGRGRKHRQTRAGAKRIRFRSETDAAASEPARSERSDEPGTPAPEPANTPDSSASSPADPSGGARDRDSAGGGDGSDTPGGPDGFDGDEPPEDPNTPEPSGRRRLAAALWPPRVSRAQLVVGILLFALGAALAIQVRSNTESDPLRGARESDLVRVLDELEQRTARLDSEKSRLEIDKAELESSNNAAAEARAQTDQRAQVLGILAGTVKATGPGITLTITDPKGAVTADMLLDTLQELRAAGAEAVQVNQVRVVAETHFNQSAPGAPIFIDEQPVTQPYVFKVIGNPQDLEPALNIPGGVIRTLERKEAQAVVVPSQQVVVDALRVPTTPDYARSAPDAGNDG